MAMGEQKTKFIEGDLEDQQLQRLQKRKTGLTESRRRVQLIHYLAIMTSVSIAGLVPIIL